MACLRVFSILLAFSIMGLSPLSAGETISSYPKSREILRLLHSNMRRYLAIFQSSTVRTNLQNGCSSYTEETFNRTPREFLFCASSTVSNNGLKLIDELRILSNDEVVQTFILIQVGQGLKETSLEKIKNLDFNLSGNKGFYRASGLTSISFDFEITDGLEKNILIFEAVNFYMENIYLKAPLLERIRYDVRCSFCRGVSWLEVQEVSREGLPDLVLYHNSDEPRDITPRLFDSQLQGLLYRPLNQLGFSIQSSLVQEAGFPFFRF